MHIIFCYSPLHGLGERLLRGTRSRRIVSQHDAEPLLLRILVSNMAIQYLRFAPNLPTRIRPMITGRSWPIISSILRRNFFHIEDATATSKAKKTSPHACIAEQYYDHPPRGLSSLRSLHHNHICISPELSPAKILCWRK